MNVLNIKASGGAREGAAESSWPSGGAAERAQRGGGRPAHAG